MMYITFLYIYLIIFLEFIYLNTHPYICYKLDNNIYHVFINKMDVYPSTYTPSSGHHHLTTLPLFLQRLLILATSILYKLSRWIRSVCGKGPSRNSYLI